MLAPMVRRLSLTGLLMASLVGTGLLFGSAAPIDSAEANSGETADKIAEQLVSSPKSATTPEPLPVPAEASRGADLRWPFFTFGRKRSGPSW
jgi:hypothetical protein